MNAESNALLTAIVVGIFGVIHEWRLSRHTEKIMQMMLNAHDITKEDQSKKS